MLDWLQHKWTIIDSLSPFLMQGLFVTFKISILAILIGSVLGFTLGILKTLHLRSVERLINVYLHVLRGSPYLVQLYIVYFVLPSLNVDWLSFDSFTAAVVSLSLYPSSYVTEIVASAICAVPHGQAEAARSVGMTKSQTLFHIVVPQALKLTVPPMASVYVIVIKSTAFLSVIGISEPTRQGEVAIMRMPGDIMFIYCLIAFCYFLYCYPVLRFSKWAETRVGGLGNTVE
jgi:polar amino acid transport system permease protein